MSKSMSPKSSEIYIKISFLPEVWTESMAREVFDLLVGQDRIFPARTFGREGSEALPSHGTLARMASVGPKAGSMMMHGDRGCGYESLILAASSWDPDAPGIGGRHFWPKRMTISLRADLPPPENWWDHIVKVSALVKAPLVAVDYVPAGRRSESISFRAEAEMKRIVRGTIHAKAEAGVFRGLSAIPWRLLLGEAFVDILPTEGLLALSPELARQEDFGLWTLETSQSSADSLGPGARENAQRIVNTLGEQYFLDPGNDLLPLVRPKVPKALMPNDQILIERYGERLLPL